MDLQRNVQRLSRLELPGAGQVTVEGKYAYVGHITNKERLGTSILDVSDPRKPRLLSQIHLDEADSHSHKARVAGDLLIVNVEQNMGALGRKAENLAQQQTSYNLGGFKLYDISNREKPRLIAHHRTYGRGVHRFDMDQNYAYISTEMEGYVGNILVIYDLKDPAHPEEIARWWMPGQHLAGGEKPTWSGYRNRLHHTLRVGDRLYASCWHAGLRVIDVSDIRKPRTVGAYDYHPPFPEPTHTVLKVPFPVGGREVAVVFDEEHDHVPGRLHAGMWLFDLTDVAHIKPISMFHLSELDSPWSRAGRFGAHQPAEHLSDTLVHASWFSGGLRIVDIADPAAPREVGHYIPEPAAGQSSPQSNDVDVDARGLIYLLDRNQGLDVLEYLPRG